MFYSTACKVYRSSYRKVQESPGFNFGEILTEFVDIYPV